MGDSTSFDTTAVIAYDSTASDIENFTDAVTNGMITDFGSTMGPLGTKCDSISSQLSDLESVIGGIGSDYTPSSIMDNALVNGMSAAAASFGWVEGGDAINMAKSILDDCDFFKNSDNLKYGDPYAQISSLLGAITAKALSEIANAIAAIKTLTGLDLLEDTIGQLLSALASTLGPISGALSLMDSLIDCLTAIGGPQYSGIIDDMMDQMDCYYGNVGVYDDPSLPNFGQFDIDSYLNDIPGIDPQTTSNIKDSQKMYNDTTANIKKSIDNVTLVPKVKKSVFEVGATATPTTTKINSVKERSVTKITVAGIEGVSETREIIVPEPEPLDPPVVPDPAPGTAPLVPYATYIVEEEVVYSDIYRDTFDPGLKYLEDYLKIAKDKISHIEIEKQDPSPAIRMEVAIVSGKFSYKILSIPTGIFSYRKEYLLISNVTTAITFTNLDTGKEYGKERTWQVQGTQWSKNLDDMTDTVYRTPVLIKNIKAGLGSPLYIFTESDILVTL